MQDLYPYYERELEFVRQLAGEFAAQYPKVAARLQLEKDRCADPHVERLIEAFALLTGRVQHKIDDEFPEVTESLLDLLYPHYLRPIPSMAIAQFGVDVDSSKPEAALVPPGTTLNSRPSPSGVCSFTTCYPVELWPIRVSGATVETARGTEIRGAASIIRLQLETDGKSQFSKLPLKSLRFYLRGDGGTPHTLYELLQLNCVEILIRDQRSGSDAKTLSLSPDCIRPVGLDAAEGVLPYSDRSFTGYRLLQEYFHFPQKFLFLDLTGLERMAGRDFGPRIEILFCFGPMERPDRLRRLEQAIDADTFQLGCTPVINLFERVAEPVRLTHTHYEYRIIPDQHRQQSTEVYSVNRVTSTAPYMEESQTYEPFYSYRHDNADGPVSQFWFARRRASIRKNDPGTEVYLSLVDLNFRPSLPPVEMLTVRVTCTNRDLPAHLAWPGDWGEVTPEGQALVRARLIRKPTPPARLPARRALQWRLISHLALNHLSIGGGGLEALKEILRLYDFSSGDQSIVNQRHIAGVVSLESKPSVGRVLSPAGISFCRGIDVALEFDEEQYAGAGVFLFASVLERFFALYAAVNSFSRLTVRTKQGKGVLKRWEPLAGEQRVL